MSRPTAKRKTLKHVEDKFQEFILEELGILELSKLLIPRSRHLRPVIEAEVNLVAFGIL
jgi:hypothetical protein